MDLAFPSSLLQTFVPKMLLSLITHHSSLRPSSLSLNDSWYVPMNTWPFKNWKYIFGGLVLHAMSPISGLFRFCHRNQVMPSYTKKRHTTCPWILYSLFSFRHIWIHLSHKPFLMGRWPHPEVVIVMILLPKIHVCSCPPEISILATELLKPNIIITKYSI